MEKNITKVKDLTDEELSERMQSLRDEYRELFSEANDRKQSEIAMAKKNYEDAFKTYNKVAQNEFFVDFGGLAMSPLKQLRSIRW
mgnify:CR=1 FL=1|tara:strand:- start:2802 stop:3056 length:255 start_codon:yes stop_codon:yes gene_type:complete